MLQQRIDEIHQQTGTPKQLIALSLAGGLSATGLGEQVMGSANALTLGGAGGVRKGLEEGDISARQGFFESVHATGASFLSGNVDFIVPGAAEYRAAREQGAGVGTSVTEGVGGAFAVPEFQTLFARDATAGERLDAAAGVAFKGLRLFIIGKLIGGARGGPPASEASVVTEGRTQSQNVLETAKTESSQSSGGGLRNRSGDVETAANVSRSYNPKGETIEGPQPARSEAPARPSWQTAQADRATDLEGFGFEAEPSYLGGKPVPYGTEGSVRPDYASESLRLAVDVKNYDVTTPKGRWRLVHDVVGQVDPRAANLPRGMRQGIIIDIRGQQVNDVLVNRMIDRIVKKSNGAILSENIHVQR